jgi:hypothetical protein
MQRLQDAPPFYMADLFRRGMGDIGVPVRRDGKFRTGPVFYLKKPHSVPLIGMFKDQKI